MKFNRIRIFTIFIIILISIITIESEKTNKKRNKNKNKNKNKIKSKNRNRLEEYQVNGNLNSDNQEWKNNRFLKHLKDQTKYSSTANTDDKYTLFSNLIGRSLNLLGLNDGSVEDYIKTLSKPTIKKIVSYLMLYQKTMNSLHLKPLLDLNIPGLNNDNIIPNGNKLLHFLNEHIKTN